MHAAAQRAWCALSTPPPPPPLQMDQLVQASLGRRLSRLDSSVYTSLRDPSKQGVRPC